LAKITEAKRTQKVACAKLVKTHYNRKQLKVKPERNCWNAVLTEEKRQLLEEFLDV